MNDESVECNKIESQAFTWTILFCICWNIFDEVFEKKIERVRDREREKLKKKIRIHKLTMFRAGKHPKYRRIAPQSDIDLAASVIWMNDRKVLIQIYILKCSFNCISFLIYFFFYFLFLWKCSCSCCCSNWLNDKITKVQNVFEFFPERTGFSKMCFH